MGGVRLDIHPNLSFLNLFFELGAIAFTYSPQYFNNANAIDGRIDGGFVIGSGVSVDVTFKNKKRKKCKFKMKKRIFFKKKQENNKTDSTTDISNTDATDVIVENDSTEDTVTVDNITLMQRAKEGDIISFTNIIFFPNSDEIKEESFDILNKIAEVLLKRKDLIIEIGGYTNSTGYPEKEMELSIKRAMKVALYLSKRGVAINRMKPSGYGGFSNGEINETNRKVEIKILMAK